ncbi:MAG: RNB domain-containing ribonuclease, partial [Burkholderiaceae bacterium]
LRALGIGLGIGDDPTPREYQAIAQATKDRPDAQQIHAMLLRSMQQAIYTPTNSGHFGLAFEAYTHFTSPIRRYPDLLVHRVIKAILGKQRYILPELPIPGEAHAKLARRLEKGASARAKTSDEKPRKLSPDTLAWQAAGLHCSANERRADEASRDVEAWLKCKYMREHLGEEYGGVVSAATSFGIFVTLDAMYVEGLVHITELGGEYFRFDEMRQELRGERTGMRYAIGTRVQVQVSRVDLDGRRIDFRLVRDSDDLTPRVPKEKGAAHEHAAQRPRREDASPEKAARRKSRNDADTAKHARKASDPAPKSTARNGAASKRSRTPRR